MHLVGLAAWLLVPVVALLVLTEAGGQVRLERVESGSGLEFVLRHEPTPRKRMIETMAGGLAVLDFNSDGRPDIYFPNGAATDRLAKTGPEFWNRLYRNDGGLRFTDVTEEAGVAGAGYSMGAAAADFDNDGDADLFLAGVYRNILYRNEGDGTFTDVTPASGIASSEWAVAADWLDYDSDSLLDLFVVNYADWTVEFDRFCGDRERGLRVYCHPRYLTPIHNRLYRNLGGGRFRDVTESVGLLSHRGRGMSAVAADFDGDGSADIFVTNDNLPNFLFLGQADGTFVEDALLSGVALLSHGRPVASMGVALADYDADGLPDLSVTALSNETFPLFSASEPASFRDETVASGLAKASRNYAGWGNFFADFDNDGWVDLFTANSHVNDLVEHFEPHLYRQPNTVFPNQAGAYGVAVEVGDPAAHRGAAGADFDGDGLIDVVVTVLGEPAKLFRNASSSESRAWVSLRLVGTESNRNGIGARIRVDRQTRWVTSAAGYASSRLAPIHFGLGRAGKVYTVEVVWPGGRRQLIENVPANQVVTVTETQAPAAP